MYHGKYEFLDFISGDVSVNYEVLGTDERPIVSPNKKLKTYHSFLNLFVFQHLLVNEDVVFSYRKGTRVLDAVIRHAANRYFYQTDLSNFFQSLKTPVIKQTIEESLDRFAVDDVGSHIDRIIDLVTIDGSMPVGFSTSPHISNGCLYHFDNRLQEYCHQGGLVFTRYSDDLIISSDNKESLQGIDKTVGGILQDLFADDLTINEGKSKFSSRGQKIKLLGLVIHHDGNVSVDSKLKQDVEVLLHFYLNDRKRFLDKLDGDAKGGIERVSGYLNYIGTVDPDYLDKLRKKYGLTVVDMFFHRSATLG